MGRVLPYATASDGRLSRLAGAACIVGLGGIFIWISLFVIIDYALYLWVPGLPTDFMSDVGGLLLVVVPLGGVVLGVAALVRIARSGGRLYGRALALTGIVASITWPGAMAITLWVMVPGRR